MRLDYIEAGEVVTTHGVHGEMKILPWTDGPEFLIEFNCVYIDGAKYNVESCRIQKSCNLLKLSGIDTMEQAQAMRGKIVKISRAEIDSDIIFAAELIGVEVYSDGKQIGKIADVLDYPGNKVYVVRGEYEYMIPAVKAFIISTDIDKGVMDVRLIEGMRSDES